MATHNDQPAISFPCDFPIKAMGYAKHDLQTIVANIVRRHAPDLSAEAVRTRPSANGKYLSVTVLVRAHSRDQLDAIYLDLTASEHILMAL